MDTNTPAARTRGLALLALAAALLLLNAFVVGGLGETVSWVVLGISIAALAVTAAWTAGGTDR